MRILIRNDARAWEETLDGYRARLKECAAFINAHFDVEALCRSLPARLRDLDERKGDRAWNSWYAACCGSMARSALRLSASFIIGSV